MHRPVRIGSRPAKSAMIVGGVIIALVGLMTLFSLVTAWETVAVRLGNDTYHLRVADTNQERAKGLSGVARLESDSGLLMTYDTDGKWGIWMKDMKISLDIVWLDRDKSVVHVVEGAVPELGTDTVFSPPRNARYVVELPAGSVKKSMVRTGETAQFLDRENS